MIDQKGERAMEKKYAALCNGDYNDVDDLMDAIVRADNQGMILLQSDVVAALDGFDLSMDENEKFFNWLSSSGVSLIEEESPMENGSRYENLSKSFAGFQKLLSLY